MSRIREQRSKEWGLKVVEMERSQSMDSLLQRVEHVNTSSSMDERRQRAAEASEQWASYAAAKDAAQRASAIVSPYGGDRPHSQSNGGSFEAALQQAATQLRVAAEAHSAASPALHASLVTPHASAGGAGSALHMPAPTPAPAFSQPLGYACPCSCHVTCTCDLYTSIYLLIESVPQPVPQPLT